MIACHDTNSQKTSWIAEFAAHCGHTIEICKCIHNFVELVAQHKCSIVVALLTYTSWAFSSNPSFFFKTSMWYSDQNNLVEMIPLWMKRKHEFAKLYKWELWSVILQIVLQLWGVFWHLQKFFGCKSLLIKIFIEYTEVQSLLAMFSWWRHDMWHAVLWYWVSSI